MGIIKVKKYDCPYVQMDKRPLTDPRLTWKAKGILAYLLSKPDNWQVWVKDLVKRSKDGESAVRAGLDELLAVGYATRQQGRLEDGTFSRTDYIVYERPHGGFPHADKPHTDKPHAENRHDSNKDCNDNESSDNEKNSGEDAKIVTPLAEQPPTAAKAPDSSEEPHPTADDDPDGAKEFLAAFGEQPDREPTSSDGDWVTHHREAQKDEPWLGWSDGKLHPRSGIGVDKLECVGWLIERETGRVPIDGQWQGWGKACAAIYQAGEGDFPAILEGIRRAWAREEQYRPRHPMGHVNEVANVKAGKKTAKDERYSEAWYKKRMQEDPQRELNEIAYERTQRP